MYIAFVSVDQIIGHDLKMDELVLFKAQQMGGRRDRLQLMKLILSGKTEIKNTLKLSRNTNLQLFPCTAILKPN